VELGRCGWHSDDERKPNRVFRKNPKENTQDDEAEWTRATPPRHFGRTLFNGLTVILVLVALALFAFGSKSYHGFKENMDADYFSDPSVPATPVSAQIFPLMLGQKQTFQVTSDPNQPELQNKITQLRDKNGTKLAVMQTTYKDKLVSVRVYALAPKGLMLVALGSGEPLRFDPPLPMLRFPLKAGDVAKWRGTLVGKKIKQAASALVRVGGAETLTQDNTKRLAYRVDMVIVISRSKDKVERQQTTLWFAPEIGLVREQSIIDGHPFLCEIKSDTPTLQP
jgi:hypothetical protein